VCVCACACACVPNCLCVWGVYVRFLARTRMLKNVCLSLCVIVCSYLCLALVRASVCVCRKDMSNHSNQSQQMDERMQAVDISNMYSQ
jgi:hypothetical protein